MNDWTEIHEGFGKKWYCEETYQQKWEEFGLTHQDAQEWTEVGFKPRNCWEVWWWKSRNFNPQEASGWIKLGLKLEDDKLISYIKWKGYRPNQVSGLDQLSAGYQKWNKKSKSVKEYLDCFYPHKKRAKVTELDISQKDIRWKALTGTLDLSEFVNLKVLDCRWHCLTNVRGLNSTKVKELDLRHNNFSSDLTPFGWLINLEFLTISNNRFFGSLKSLAKLRKLKSLDIDNTGIDGGLEYLPDSLKRFSCRKTKLEEELKPFTSNPFVGDVKKWREWMKDKKNKWKERGFNNKEIEQWINAGIKIDDHEFVAWLKDVKKFGSEWVVNCREDYETLKERYNKYGLCQKCQQFNSTRSFCQLCREQEWQQQNIKQLTGQELIKKFTQQQKPKEIENSTWGGSELQWIPYEQFTDIEHIADGGFSKIYKTKWRGKKVALKVLNSSCNITLEFLTEIANTKLVDDSFNVVRCYGISQELITKSYAIVMHYMREGNLRQYLLNKSSELSLRDKLYQLYYIANGLNDIHQKNLVHRDLHSGNVLNNSQWSAITDLGLSRPANLQKEEGKIFGVLPFVAPEVLQGQSYMQTNDIYSFGIIAYEIFSNSSPYLNRKYDISLSLDICRGLRPNLDKLKIPRLLRDLIEKCWDSNPKNRPKASVLERTLRKWQQEEREFSRQLREIEAEYNQMSKNSVYKSHSTDVMTSKLIDTKEIAKRLQTEKCQPSKNLELNLDNFNQLTIQETKSSSSFQYFQEAPPKPPN